MNSSGNSDPVFYVSKHVRLIIWRVIYWLAFVLTWAILPVLQSFVESGHHDPMKKLVDSLRSNAKYQAVLLGSGLVGFLYVVLTSGLSLSSIKSLVIALSYLYALVMAIWLMGHGMVNLPRELWILADVNKRLSNDYRTATKTCDSFAEAQSKYFDVVDEIRSIGRFKDGSKYLEWIDELIDEVDLTEASVGGAGIPRPSNTSHNIDRSMLNEQYLSTLAAKFYKYRARMIRYRSSWQKLLKDCSIAEDIINASSSGNSSELIFRYGRTRLPKRIAKYYYVHIDKYLSRAFAVVLSLISVIIVWSELAHGTVASLVNLIISITFGINQQIVSSIFLGYMCICSFLSLTNIRIFNIYGLVHKGSDLSSMMFYATYACRLTVPLSYNYLTLIGSRESVFEEFLGKSINLTPLGKFVNDWLPRLIVIPIIFTLFHIYDKIKGYFSFELGFDDDEEEAGGGYLNSSIIEGKELVNRALSDPRFRYAIDGASPDSLRASTTNYNHSRTSLDYRTNTRTFGLPSVSSPPNELSSSPLSDGISNVKSFFSNLGQRFSSIRLNANDSLPRWQSEEEDEPLVL